MSMIVLPDGTDLDTGTVKLATLHLAGSSRSIREVGQSGPTRDEDELVIEMLNDGMDQPHAVNGRDAVSIAEKLEDAEVAVFRHRPTTS